MTSNEPKRKKVIPSFISTPWKAAALAHSLAASNSTHRVSCASKLLHITNLHSSLLLPLNSSNYLPRMPTSPKLQVPNPLPRPCRQLPITNRHRNTRAYQCRFNVRGHIIQSLVGMSVEVPFVILGSEAVKGVAYMEDLG